MLGRLYLAVLKAPLVLVLLTQTACVGAVMAAANHREMEDREALKIWLSAHATAEQAACTQPLVIAPIIYYDFDRDTHDELVINAARCTNSFNDANINLVLAEDGDGNFTSWPIQELTQKQREKANLPEDAHYRLSVDNGALIATFRAGKTNARVTYRREEQGFTIDKLKSWQ